MDTKKYLKENLNRTKRDISRPIVFHLFLFSLGVISILVGNTEFTSNKKLLSGFLITLGQALIIGSSISYILDLPSMEKFFQKRIVDTLTSNDYLKELKREDLLSLRNACTTTLHINNTSHFEEGLLVLDEKICDLLTEPYYDRYRHTITCNFENEYIRKKVYVESLFLNPSNKRIKESVNFNTLVYKDDEKPIEEIFKVKKFKITIDDNEPIELAEDISIESNYIYRTGVQYNCAISLKYKNSDKIEFEFDDKLKVERITDLIVSKNDLTYSKRLTVPTKNFRLDYIFNEKSIELFGSFYGTLSSPNKGNMKILNQKNQISMESYNWMLPGNGVFIIGIPDEKKKEVPPHSRRDL